MPNNLCIFQGRLTKDAEQKKIGQKDLYEFSIAVNMGKDKEGKDKQALFINCKAWDKTGEIIANNHKKGDLIDVYGYIELYTTDKGKIYLTLNVSGFSFIKQKSDPF